MSPIVYLALIGWAPLTPILFAVLPARRAVVCAFVAGWLLLPEVTITLPAFPDYGKLQAISLGVVLGILFFDQRRLQSLKPGLIDLPLLAWLLCPVPTSVYNGLGAYDGFSEGFRLCLVWGVPILVGRIYFRDFRDFRELAVGIVAGAVVYIPLCWIEVLMSPQLHRLVYGFHPSAFFASLRYGGYRPMVFMVNGLAVALYMGTGSFLAYWLYRAKLLKGLFTAPIELLLLGLMTTTVLCCKSVNGIMIMLLGMASYHLFKMAPTKAFLLLLAAIPPTYIALRASDTLPARVLSDAVSNVDEERAASLAVRLRQEDLFSDHAWSRPWFGWGGWMRFFPVKENGERVTRAIDALWTLTLSKHGLFGLFAWTATMLTGPVFFALRVPAKHYLHPQVAPATAMALLCVLYCIDSLMNDIKQPMFVIAMGGLVSCCLRWRQQEKLLGAGSPKFRWRPSLPAPLCGVGSPTA